MVFPNNLRPLCQRRHLQNVYNLQVNVFHSMSKVWQQHICREMKFNCCYHSEILLTATTGRHSAAASVTVDTLSASFSTGIPKWRDLFKSRLWQPVQNLSTALPARGCHALQHVIGWELSCTCIVTSWSQRRRPKHGGLADRWGRLAMIAYGRKFATKIQC